MVICAFLKDLSVVIVENAWGWMGWILGAERPNKKCEKDPGQK